MVHGIVLSYNQESDLHQVCVCACAANTWVAQQCGTCPGWGAPCSSCPAPAISPCTHRHVG